MIADPQLAVFEEHTNAASLKDKRDFVFESLLRHNLPGRRFMITDTDLLCLGAGSARTGDLICVLLGCSTSVILRQCKDYYIYVGDVFLDEYMYGKAIEELNTGVRELQTFEFR
jgi:hypothetical protein